MLRRGESVAKRRICCEAANLLRSGESVAKEF
jgi:hypothetical protein